MTSFRDHNAKFTVLAATIQRFRTLPQQCIFSLASQSDEYIASKSPLADARNINMKNVRRVVFIRCLFSILANAHLVLLYEGGTGRGR